LTRIVTLLPPYELQQHWWIAIFTDQYIFLLYRILVIMGENKWMGKRWEDMDTDVLVKIFKELNLVELSPVSQVCRLWRMACADPLIWGTLDFGLLKSNFIQTRASPYMGGYGN
jgi:hypothetical protein